MFRLGHFVHSVHPRFFSDGASFARSGDSDIILYLPLETVTGTIADVSEGGVRCIILSVPPASLAVRIFRFRSP